MTMYPFLMASVVVGVCLSTPKRWAVGHHEGAIPIRRCTRDHHHWAPIVV